MASVAKQMLETHPQHSGGGNDLVVRCIEACFECSQACSSCADACLGEESIADMRRCIRLDLDCSDLCLAAGRIVTRQTESNVETVRAVVEACAAACKACGDECESHAGHHEHCKVCAAACRRCEEACRSFLASLN